MGEMVNHDQLDMSTYVKSSSTSLIQHLHLVLFHKLCYDAAKMTHVHSDILY